MSEQVQKSHKRSKLIIALVAGILVLAALAGVLVFFLMGPSEDEVIPDDGNYLLYWNLDREQYAGQAADGKTSREMDDKGFYNIRLAYRGKMVTRKTKDREIANQIDSYDVLGLSLKDGIITDVQSIDEFTGGFACEGMRTYVTEIKGEKVTTSLKGDKQFELTISKDTKVYDVSGETDPVGGITVLRKDDQILAVQDKQGLVTDIFVISRADLGLVRFAYCEHCKQEVKWTGWDKYTVLPVADSGHYYLMNDITAKAQASLQADVEIVLDLNGKTIQGKEDNRVFSLHNQGCYLAIMDSSPEKTGLVKAGDSMLLIHQGACVWVRYGVFELFSGTLDASAAYSVNNGAAVCVPKDAVFNMYGGTITGGTISTKYDPTTQRVSMGMGGNVYVAGTFNMYGGLITKGKAESYYFRDTGTYSNGLGGNVYVGANATFTMTGGELRDGTSHGGGGNVFVNAHGTFSMSGDAKVTGGKTIRPGKNGGSIYVANKGIFNLESGTVEGGATTNRGGNLVLYGVLNMTGGSITNGYKLDEELNQSLADFSNIFVVNGEVNMSAGYIDGHVYLQNTTTGNGTYNVNLSGTAQIKDAEEGYANLYIRGDHPIHVGELKEGAEIHVTASGIFTTQTAEANKKYFHLDYPEVGVVYYENCLFAGRMGCICGTQDGVHFGECDGKQLAWGGWSSKTSLPTTTGNYYLIYDVDLRGQISVTNEANIVLDLNGKNVQATKDGRIYSLHGTEVPVSITVTDSSKGQTGKMIAASVETKNEGLLFWLRRSTKPHTLTIYGGTFDASGVVNTKGGAGIHGTEGSTINIYGGTIIGGAAKSVWNDATAGFVGGRGGTIYTTGNLNMTGGTVKGGKAIFTTKDVQVTNEDGTVSVVTKTGDAYGGNIVLAGDYAVGTFTGGTIEGGSAVLGGNIYIGNKSTATINGATVKDGIAEKSGGNIYMGQYAVITMDGGQILGGQNTAEGANGGSVYVSGPSVFVMNGGLVSGGKSMNMGGNFDVRGILQVTGGEIKDGVSSVDKTDSVHSNIALVNLGTSSNKGTLIMTGGHIYGGIYSQTALGEVFNCVTVSGNAKITAPEGYLGVTLKGDSYVKIGGTDLNGKALGGLTEGAEIWINQTIGRQAVASGTETALTVADAAFFKHETGYYTLREDGMLYLERTVEVTNAQELHDALQAGYSVILKNDIDYDASKIVDATADKEAPGVINARNRITLDMKGFTITYTPAPDTDPEDDIPAANKFINLMGTCELTITGDGAIIHKLTMRDQDNGAMFRVAAGKLTIENGTFERVYAAADNLAIKLNRFLIWNSGSGVVEIKGGTFRNHAVREIYSADKVTITGGTFFNNPVNYGVAQGYGVSKKTVEDKTWWVVDPAVKVGTAQELHDALQAGRSVILTGDILYNAADILADALDSDKEVASIINVAGYITLDMNGFTITYNPADDADPSDDISAANKFFNMTGDSRLTITGNGTITHNVPFADKDNAATFRVAAGELVIENGTIQRVFTDENTKETIRGWIFWDSGGGKLTIKGGTFLSGDARVAYGDGYANGITGGTFNYDPTDFGLDVENGYDVEQVTEGETTLYVVTAPTMVGDAQQLHDALQAGKNVVLSGSFDYIAGQITDAAAGDAPAGIITVKDKVLLNLNGNTITYIPDGKADKFIELAEGADLVINGNGTIEHKIMDAAAENGAMFRVAAGKLTIQDGTFRRSYTTGVEADAKAKALIWDTDDGMVVINGGTFYNDSAACIAGESAVPGVSGGTFNTDPSNSLAFAHVARKDVDGNFVVELAGVHEALPVKDAAQLKLTLETGRVALLEADITYDLEDILCGENAKLDLNGHTITFVNTSRINIYKGYKLTINGDGAMVQNNGMMFRVSDRGQLVINGGTFTASGNIIHAGGNNADSVTINGGTFNGAVNSYMGSMTISGGTFNGAVTAAPVTECNVTGGSYKQNPASLLVGSGLSTYLDSTTGMYVIVSATEQITVTTADDLRNALMGGCSVKLGSDIEYTLADNIQMASGVTATLDLNGYTIRHTGGADRLFNMFAGGSAVAPSSLTITDSGETLGGIESTQKGMFRVNTNATYGDAVLNIEGGKFQCSGQVGVLWSSASKISGGLFSGVSTSFSKATYIADGCKVIGPVNGYYMVVETEAPAQVRSGLELKTALQSGKDVALAADVRVDWEDSQCIAISGKTVTLDLNGHILDHAPAFSEKAATGTRLFNLLSGTVLTTKDSVGGGTIQTTARMMRVNTGTTWNVLSGTYKCLTAGNNIVFWDSGTVAISGGSFTHAPGTGRLADANAYTVTGPVDGLYTVVAKN